MKAFERVQIVPINGAALAGPNEREWAVRYCQAALRAGIDEIQVNFTYLPLHPELVANPAKVPDGSFQKQAAPPQKHLSSPKFLACYYPFLTVRITAPWLAGMTVSAYNRRKPSGISFLGGSQASNRACKTVSSNST